MMDVFNFGEEPTEPNSDMRRNHGGFLYTRRNLFYFTEGWKMKDEGHDARVYSHVFCLKSTKLQMFNKHTDD